MNSHVPTGHAALEARNIAKVFPGTTALDGVSLRLESGRVHALIGENGAGKSTLVRILAGVHPPTRGQLLVDGTEVRFESARDAAERGIGIIHQELQLFPDLSVTENLFVGRERCTRWGTVDWRAQTAAAERILATLGQSFSPRVLLGSLPLGQQQIVEIARALVEDVRILMLDEPTSALTAAEVPVLFQVIRDLAAHGVAMVYISHRLEEILRIADVVTVLRDGRVVGESPTRGLDAAWIVERMTGRPVVSRPSSSTTKSGPTLLSVRDLRLDAKPGRSQVDGVSFDLHRGEVIGVYGLMGAGRTEVFESLMGVHADATGDIRLGGESISALDVSERAESGMAIVPEDRQAAGLVGTMSVRENMTLASLSRLSRHGYLSPAGEAREVARLTEALHIKAPGPGASIGALSGGNQQKVVIARGVMSRPAVLLMDEPTRGVDVAAKAEILDTIRRLAADGLGVMLSSSDLAEVRAAATRVLVLSRGRISAEFPVSDATDHALAEAASQDIGRDGGDRGQF